ncbi:MAG: hypothetical protein A2X64_11150 [Ignavibacteria bacterium GWF2_33_9]|nr:MAG: hypothetical protein A2X64_11150 [Ignavibacteria bacterium GWF2_33_9]
MSGLYAQKNYIIKFKKFKKENTEIIQNKFGLKKLFNSNDNKFVSRIQSKKIKFDEDLYFTFLADDNNSQFLNNLKQDESIEYIEENHIFHINKTEMPNDSFVNFQWARNAVHANDLWKTYSGEGIVIGLVDTGIDFNHEDLKNELWINSDEDLNHNGTFEPWSENVQIDGIYGDFNGLDDDGNGFTDDVIGYDFVNQDYANFGDWTDPDPIPDDQGRHGTGVAGIIAAEGNNKLGIIGIAHKSKVMTTRVFDATGNAEMDDIANGILYCIANGAKVINMSFGDPFKSLLLQDVISYANASGCIMVASSGNENTGIPHFPSDYDCVISVGASTSDNVRSSISNYGVNLSLVAPGENVLTLETGNSYHRISGTSFSAPFVSGAAALLLQKYPNLTSSQIRSTLEANASKLKAEGWDRLTGAGLLNISQALQNVGISDYDISGMTNYDFLADSTNKLEPVIISQTPLFESFQLEYSYDLTKGFSAISNVFQKQQVNPLKIETEFVPNKDFILSLKLNLQNGQILRKNKAMRVTSLDDTNRILTLKTLKSLSALKNGNRVWLITAVTNIPCSFWVEYSCDNQPQLKKKVYELEKNDTEHTIILDDFMQQGKYTATAYFIPFSQNEQKYDTLKREFTFDYMPLKFPSMNFTEKPYKLPRAFVNNHVEDLFKNGKKTVIINNLQEYYIGNTEVYEFENNKFILRDSSAEGWIPIEYGKINYDENTDVLYTQNAKSIVTSASQGGESPLTKLIFSSELGHSFWAEGFKDFDGDGLDEILGYNDTTYFIFKNYNGDFRQFKVLELDSISKKGVTKGSAIGDFDGDGNIEVFHSNYYGNLFMFEFKEGRFSLEWSDLTNYGYSNPVVTSINLPGKNNPAIVIGTFGSKILFDKSESNDVIWSYRLIQSNNADIYTVDNFENILGVRAGIDPRLKISYRNGVTIGNIDNDEGEELIISEFPNILVWKWVENSFKPVWQYPYSFANSAIIHDFDGNGINEIGFGTWDSTAFFEINSAQNKLDAPIVNKAFSINENEVFLQWFEVPNADKYKIYDLRFNPNGDDTLYFKTEVTDNFCSLSDIKVDDLNYYLIKAFDENQSMLESDFSELITVFAHNPIKAINVEVLNENHLFVTFNGRIKENLKDISTFQVSSNMSFEEFSPSTIQSVNDSTYILTFAYTLLNGEYIIKIGPFDDYWGTPVLGSELSFTINESNESILSLASLEIVSLNELLLAFSEDIDESSSELTGNYSINPLGDILDVQRIESNKVKIMLDNEIKNSNIVGNTYSVTVLNVKALSGNKMVDGRGNTLSFVLSKSNLDNAFAFPNPFSLAKDEILKFGNLTKESKIEISDLNGKILKTIEDKSADGGVSWDLMDNTGQKLEIGIYFFRVEGITADGKEISTILKKFAIVP